jgi:glycosyltransferase involved in cell wall biosynthesis
VYQNENNQLIRYLNEKLDAGIFFTKYWEKVAQDAGFKKPSYLLEHGISTDRFYPIPQKIARKYFDIPGNDFIIMNLNRNQPRKRWDITLMAFVKYMSTNMDKNVKLLIATSLKGGWDLVDILISECRKYSVNIEELKKHLIIIASPQKLSDKDINVLYNVADIGLNTASGEGFGLCSYEHAAIGIPQVLANVGGIKDFFTKDNCFLVHPKWSFYSDMTHDLVCGEAEVCAIDDIVQMFEYAYRNRNMLPAFGLKARKGIVEKYSWKDKGKQLYDIIKELTHKEKEVVMDGMNLNISDVNVFESGSKEQKNVVVKSNIVGDVVDSRDAEIKQLKEMMQLMQAKLEKL